MKTVVITGGAGFLGSHLCDLFIKKGHRVICLDNFLTGKKSNVAALERDRHFVLVEQDVSRPFRVAGSVHLILHFASPASPVDYYRYPLETMRVGSMGTHHALELARAKKAVFLMASTSEIYGDPLVHPQTEEYWGNVNPIGPRSVYDETKRFSEALTMAYRRAYLLDTKIVRIFNTYGPRMRIDDGRAIPNFIAQALKNKPLTIYGNGMQTRSFCYVSDLVEGIYRLSRSRYHDPVNLGNPREMTLKELIVFIRTMTNSKSKIVYKPLPKDDPKQRQPDISRARVLLKWQPRVAVEEGLPTTIAWFRDRI
ncbi:MAG: SDR family oxidoreductase [Candidatus Omnitrophica bacterium]|nr:SDR family oxidoreductase [Candidatus Omnitrophota bacterium]